MSKVRVYLKTIADECGGCKTFSDIFDITNNDNVIKLFDRNCLLVAIVPINNLELLVIDKEEENEKE